MKRFFTGFISLMLVMTLFSVITRADGRVPVPDEAPSFSTYTAMSGIAWDPAVADLANGATYKALWDGAFYSFTVGTNVFATFEQAYAAAGGAVPAVFALSGALGSIQITGPVRLYGYYFRQDPNYRSPGSTDCPALNPAREWELESAVGNVTVAAGTTGEITLCGLELRGVFGDQYRAVSTVETDITLKNIVIRHQSGVASGTWAINLNNPNNSNTTTGGAGNCDRFTMQDCRIEHLETTRISGNFIPPVYTVDGLVTVDGATTYYGFPQWKRYYTNAVFSMTNCYFENFHSTEGKNQFMIMEGLNKYNGSCEIRYSGNTLTGDCSEYALGFFVKRGYQIDITGNTFRAKEATGLQPFNWDIAYDKIYDDFQTAADVSAVDLSDRINICRNRFIGYTNLTRQVNSATTVNFADNFFTDDLSGYRSAAGIQPQTGAGNSAAGYRMDYEMQRWNTDAPEIDFPHAAAISEGNSWTFYTTETTLNLYDYGLSLPAGVSATLSGGASLEAVPLEEGANPFTLQVSSYGGGTGRACSILIYSRAGSQAVERLNQALVWRGSGCYTESTLEGLSALIEALREKIALRQDTSALEAQLDTLEAGLARAQGAVADMMYYDLFLQDTQYQITTPQGWRRFAAAVNAGAPFYGKTVTLAADLDFGGQTIEPVGGAYTENVSNDNPSFFGTLEGGGHTIRNFVINKPDRYGVGLFGRVSCGIIRNLRVGPGSVTGFDKVGGIAGFGDGTLFENCTNEADVSATNGGNGIGGIISQGRSAYNPYDKKNYTCRLIGCINYGSVTTPKGRACGIAAWGQGSTLQQKCINYGTLSGPAVYAFGQYATGTNLSSYVIDCYYYGAADAGPGTPFTDSAYAAWNCGFDLWNDRAVLSGLGAAVYRARLQCSSPEGTYDCYGPAGAPLYFSIPGYHLSSVRDSGNTVRNLFGAALTANETFTGAAEPFTYRISYQLNGGSFTAAQNTSFTVADTVVLPDASLISKSGAVFEGWYETADFSSARLMEIPAGTHRDYTLYAKYVTLARTISTKEQLVTLANDVNAGQSFAGQGIQLAADLNLSGVSFPVIGSALTTPFSGVFSGNGHQITNLAVSGKPAAGLIGALGAGGIVTGVSVAGSVAGNMAGGIVGNNMGGIIEHCSFNGSVSASATPIKVISQNLRVNSSADLHGAADRHTPLKNILLACDADIIGFQEADATWQSYLPSDFSAYSYVWTWRGLGSNNTTQGKEATPVFYKKSKFDLVDSGSFWLSSTPGSPSYCFNESMNRIVTWVKLRVKTTGEIICYFNTHFPLDEDSRNQSVAVLKEKVLSITGGLLPTYITADYNMTRGSSPYNLMTAWCQDLGSAAQTDATNNSGTFNGFSVTPTSLIDFCFGFTERTAVPYYKVVLDTYTDSSGRVCPPSDHYAIYLETTLESGSGPIAGINKGTLYHCQG